MTSVSKQICKVLCQAWTGFVGAMKAWKKDPSKFLGKPKLPGYKHKTDGRNVVIYPDESVSIPGLRKGLVVLTRCGILIPTKTQTVDQVRIVPQKTCYVIEVVYTAVLPKHTQGDALSPKNKPSPNNPTINREASRSTQEGWAYFLRVRPRYSAAIDKARFGGKLPPKSCRLGLSNLMTATSNNPGIKPLIVNGKPLKAINQLFNKRKAKTQSNNAIRQSLDLVHKRNNRVYNYLHTASRRVINWCLANGISQLIVGKNDSWKQDINIGRSNNQQFTAIPHSRLIQMLEYKGALAGIKVITTEEAYTSKASSLDGDALPKYGKTAPSFSGRRIKRGLYRSKDGRLINADVNGSLNIGRKVIPDFMKGIEEPAPCGGSPPLRRLACTAVCACSG